MKLHEFLSLIQDEDLLIELELGLSDDCCRFWLSDYRADLSAAEYKNRKVDYILFDGNTQNHTHLKIGII